MFSVSKKEGELVGPRTCVSLFMEFWNVGIAQRRFWVVIAAKESQFGQGCPVMRQLFIYSYSFWLFIKAPWSQFQAPTFFPMKTSPAWIIGTLIRNRQCHCPSDIPEGNYYFLFATDIKSGNGICSLTEAWREWNSYLVFSGNHAFQRFDYREWYCRRYYTVLHLRSNVDPRDNCEIWLSKQWIKQVERVWRLLEKENVQNSLYFIEGKQSDLDKKLTNARDLINVSENTYLGWRYDSSSGKLYQVDGHDATANVQQGTETNSVNDYVALDGKSKISYLQQTS